ncbi:MAG: polysaccharide deacetylase family protein [Pseudomonadota bacterium]
MSVAVYQPQSDLVAKVRRRLSRHLARRAISPTLSKGIVSLSFDDCPRSVLDNALPQIEARGWAATIYASLGLCNTTNHLGPHMSETDLQSVSQRGHEIGDHSFSHMDAMQAGPTAFLADIARNRAGFDRLDLPRARTFAYPYGEVTPSVKRVVGREFALSRGIHDPDGASIDLDLAASARLYSNTIGTVLDQVDVAARDRRWLILFGHDVRDNPSEFGCTPDELTTVLDRISALDLDVHPVATALDIIQQEAAPS